MFAGASGGISESNLFQHQHVWRAVCTAHAPGLPAAQATIDRARFLAGALELEWALGGIQSKDMSLLLVHLGRARDGLPMLTPWP
jgi:hypothetical protein